MEIELKRKENKRKDVIVGDIFKIGEKFFMIKKIPGTQKYTGFGLGHEDFYGVFYSLKEMQKSLERIAEVDLLLGSEYDYKLFVESK